MTRSPRGPALAPGGFGVPDDVAYLDTAHASPLPRVAEAAVVADAADAARRGSAALEDRHDRLARLRAAYAGLLGAGSDDDVALVANTTQGLGLVAAGLDWAPGDVVIVPATDHPTTVLPWRAQERRGVVVTAVPTAPGRRRGRRRGPEVAARPARDRRPLPRRGVPRAPAPGHREPRVGARRDGRRPLRGRCAQPRRGGRGAGLGRDAHGRRVEAVWAWSDHLAQRLATAAIHAGLSVVSPRDAGARSSLVTVHVPGVPVEVVADRMRRAHVVASGRDAGLRFSPAAWNVEADVDRALEVLGDL